MKCAALARVAGVLLVLVAPAWAHHEVAAKFDTSRSVTLKGFVTQIDWSNPHAHVFFSVRTANKLAIWATELESPVELKKNGWSATTLKIGDEITVGGNPARDGTQSIWGNSVLLAGKLVLVGTNPARPAPTVVAARSTPRWPDGHPRLGPAPGESGYWGNPSSTVLTQTGANVPMDAYGLLRNIADVDKVAPFQKWARDLYELRQRNFLKDDPLFLFCKPPGGPRQYQNSYGLQFEEDLDRQRIVVFLGGGNHNYRIIYTDGRPQVGQLRGDADNPLYYGRASGKWEGDTLVVDIRGFNDKFWFTNGGLPHTDQLHLIERLTRTDSNTMKFEVMIDDPGAYAKPWTSGWTLQWIPGQELPFYVCQDNRP